jgi:hypothetical protein
MDPGVGRSILLYRLRVTEAVQSRHDRYCMCYIEQEFEKAVFHQSQVPRCDSDQVQVVVDPLENLV